MAIVRIARNAVVAKLIEPAREVRNFVNSLLSYETDNTGISGGWSGKSSFFSIGTYTFPAGFAYLVQQELQAIGHTVHMIQRPLPAPLGPESPMVDDFGNDNPDYDYQMRALKQVEKHGAGIIRVATGGGKSKISKLVMKRYNRPTLFLTTRGVLMYQMDEQLRDLGDIPGQIGDGELRATREINLGMVQTFISALEETTLDKERRAVISSIHASKTKNENMPAEDIAKLAAEKFNLKIRKREAIVKFLGMIEVVIGEEAHEAGGNSYFEILRHCKNANIRVALTATPFMRSSAADNMRLMAAFGPVLIDISEDLLIKRGILAKPIFKFVDAPHPKILHRTSPFERAYKLGYTENTLMHALIVGDARKAAERSLPVLALVARKQHGEALLEAYVAAGLRFVFLKGADDMAERRKQLARLISGELHGVIGTTIMDVGVDIPAIGLVQLCGGMKAQVSLRQRVGRGLRRKKLVANIAFIADYSCNFNSALRDHARQRENIIRSIPGFVEGILAEGEDFPWDSFSIT
jgi:superfamily II DNA or RNA helicase